jgi:hypothetical protein
MVRSTGSMAPVVIDSPGREMTLPASTSPGVAVSLKPMSTRKSASSLRRSRTWTPIPGAAASTANTENRAACMACSIVVHQDGDLVLVLEQQDLPAVPARARAQQAKPLRARRQHEFRDLFDEPIVEGSAQLAQTVVVVKQPGSIDHARSLISMKER